MSSAPTELVNAGLAKIDDDLSFVMRCFREVLEELGEPRLAALVPWTGPAEAPHEGELPARLGQVYATAFQLLNLIEETVSTQVRRAREKASGPASEPGLWGANLQRLAAAGLTPEQIAEGIGSVMVEPVLTAHPTEAKRPAALEQHRRLFNLLQEREDPRRPPLEVADLREDIKVTLERLWRTGEILLQKPEVAAERRNLMYYFREVFPRALPELDRRLRQAWGSAGFDPEPLAGRRALPRLRFGTWVGGDRDGHPLVTAQTTRETLAELRAGGLHVINRQLNRLAGRLCLSHHVQSPPPAFAERLRLLLDEAGARGRAVVHDSPEEPWKQYVRLLVLKLPHGTGNRDGQNHYARASELGADLEHLYDSLIEIGARRIARQDVLPALRAVEAFGFHLAALDIRQNSRFHDLALGQLMRLAGFPGGFDEWPEERRLEFIESELLSPRPFAQAGASAGPEADAVVSCYRLLVEHYDAHGPAGLGALIVSMTRRLSDLLAVYVLAREAGLARNTPEGLVCLLSVTPLFETPEDLEGAPEIMRAFLAHPVTRRSLAEMAGRSPGAAPLVQQVMIGYSDSNKESGILASQWALHRAQKAITEVGQQAGVRIRFFHGRGGTISRGAGPTHRFLDALPDGAISGDLRVTEQGETIAQKYANAATANFNLELLLASAAGASLRPPLADGCDGSEPAVDQLVEFSREVYEGLLQEKGFMEFYGQATPIDALESSSIGSRPARRTGQRTLGDLRAIPWVFSWNQSRFYLPGWYGVGSAFSRLRQEEPAAFERLKARLSAGWPFLRYVLMNVETNLASADLRIMGQYAGLVPNVEVRERFLGKMVAEFECTREMLGVCFDRPAMDARPRAAKTLALRADALRVLHQQQIDLLRRWRGLRGSDEDAAKKMLPELLLSINAIASGLRTTG